MKTEPNTMENLTKEQTAPAEAFADSKDRRGTSYWKGLHDGYLAASGSVAAPKEEPKEESELIAKLKSIQPDFDRLQSYQHGFHDGVGVAIDIIETYLIKKSQKL